jgi:hypothetical protein
MLARSRIFYQTCPAWQHERIKQTRHGGEIVFELLVAIFNLLHEGFALEEVALEVGGELPGNDQELVVGHIGKRHGAVCRN